MIRRNWASGFTFVALTALATPARAEGFTYWSMWNAGEPQQKVLARAIEDFTKDTGVEVKVQWQGRDNLKKLAPALNSATPPADLVDGAQRNVKAVLVSTGSALDMNDAYRLPIPGESGTVGDVIPAAQLPAVTADGHVFLVPYEVISSLWWYDAAAMPGFQAPKDWAAFTALLAARKAAGHAPIALDGDIATYHRYYFAEIAVRLLGPGKLLAAISDRSGAALKDPRILQAAQLLEGLVKSGELPFHAVTVGNLEPPVAGGREASRVGRFASPDALITPGYVAQAAVDPGIRIEPAWKASIVYGMPCAIYHVVPAAYYLAARFRGDFESAVLHAINGGGQNQSRAMLTGALVGAQVGLSGIPQRFIDGLVDGPALLDLCRRLAEHVPVPTGR